MKSPAENLKIRRAPQAFSLVELLVVITIAVILVSVSASGFGNITRSFNIGIAGQQFFDQLNLARQTAVTQNRAVEFRIYMLPDSNASSNTPTVFRAMQTFLLNDTSTNAVNQVTYLPRGIVMNNDIGKSSLLSLTKQDPSSPEIPALPGIGKNYRYISFRFRASGEIDLPAPTTENSWFITMQSQTDRVVANGLPANYVTVQINPLTGRIRVDQP